MANVLDQEAQNSFVFSEYFLMPMPTGKKATNLRELLQFLREMTEPVLNYHLWQTRLSVIQPTVEYPNDFALWAATALHDDLLAEKLSAIDPFDYKDLTEVREAMVEELEEYLWDSPHYQVRPGYELELCEASAVILHSGISARTLGEFCGALQAVGLNSVYFHFVEARRRLGDRKMDDFSHWIADNFTMPSLVSAIGEIDIYFYTLAEIRDAILALVQEQAGTTGDQTK
ncbi:MAG: DUF5752 family protein [Desulfobaccales bacterium]